MSKRTFKEIRLAILNILETPKSITQIAKDSGTTWKTAQKHLLWLEKVEDKVKIVRKSKRKIIYKRK